MENNSNSGVIYQGKIPNRVKYCFAFGALGKDLIYGMTFDILFKKYEFLFWKIGLEVGLWQTN